MPPSTTAGNSPVVPQTPQPQQPQFPQSQPQTPEEQSIPSPVVPPQSNFNCAGKENGPYPMGQCSNQYTICSNGFAHLQTCPGQLVFSPAANNSCEFMEVCQRYTMIKKITYFHLFQRFEQHLTTRLPERRTTAGRHNPE